MNQLEQNSLNKVLELLKLPQDTDVFTGQINTCTRYSLVENRFIDKTYVNEKFRREDKVISSIESVGKTIELGAYNHNLLSNYLHGYGYDAVGFIGGEYRMDKDGITFVADAGEFAGKEFYIGWGEVSITPTVDGFDMRVENEPWAFEETNGLPCEPKISILRLTTVKTGTISVIPSLKKVTVTNVRVSTRPTKDYPSYTQAEMEAKTGMDEYQIAKAMATVFHLKFKDVNTHCVALSTDIEVDGSVLRGCVYINGQKSTLIDFKALTSSYNKKLPDFVTRWKVYHPSNTQGSIAYGTALPVIQNESTEDNSIVIVKGDALSYAPATRTLTYIDGTKLIFDFEFYPAQGKNETWGSTIELDSFVEDIFV
jgi:hypothetical protein